MRRLRVHLLVLVLGALLPGTVLTGVLVWRAFANNRDAAERRLLESARVDAAALDREFAGVISSLDALATSPALDRGDLAAFHAEARRIQRTQPGWFTVLLLSLDGRQLLSTRFDWGTPLFSAAEPDSLQRLVETRQPVVGVIRPPQRGGPEHLFPIRIPVVRDGDLRYVLTAVVDVASLERLVPKQGASPDEWTRTILDAEGTIAVRTRGAKDFIGTQATEAFRDLIRREPEAVSERRTREGVPVYTATGRSAHGWTTAVVVPRAALDAPPRASMAGLLLGGALLMACGLAAVLFVSRRLSADLEAATTAAEAVADGRPFVSGAGHVEETRRLQRSLASTAAQLESRARERDDEMRRAQAARADAEQANRTKDEFLAVLGHELRNPLAPAVTALELMRTRDPGVFTHERQILERQVAHMTRLVNDLLDVSRLSRDKVELERRTFEIREAVDRAVDMVQPLVAQRGHTLRVSMTAQRLPIHGDSDRIVQILANLLTNAAKYTPPGGHITLSTAALGSHIRIACEDDGPGVPPHLLDTLFDPFAQGPRSLDRGEGGLGLGLALARSFTELHGGVIFLEPVDSGTGSRFVVTLPMAADPPRPAPSARPAEVVVARRVLIVDDNADAIEMLRTALGGAGHVVATAVTAPDALTVAAEFGPEVGVLDIGLPGMDGYELARRLRAGNRRIRLIALTGYGQETDVQAAHDAGFDVHCAKPVTTARLLRLIDGRADSSAAGLAPA